MITVTALASGVHSAQGKVLGSLYGVGTDITVTTATRPASGLGQITPEPYVQHSRVREKWRLANEWRSRFSG